MSAFGLREDTADSVACQQLLKHVSIYRPDGGLQGCSDYTATQFTYSTSTKIQILTQQGRRSSQTATRPTSMVSMAS